MKSEATSVPSTRLSRLSSSTDVAPIAWSRRARRTHGRTPQRARPRGARPLASPAGGAARPRALTSLTLRSQSRTTSFRNHVCMRPNRYPLVEPRPIKSLSYLLSHSSVGATRVDSSLGYDSTILSRGPCRTNSDASWTWLMMYPILSHKVLYSRPHTLARPVPLASLSNSESTGMHVAIGVSNTN